MLFRPKRCPNCGIKWSDHAKRGICDLCGYDLSRPKEFPRDFQEEVHIKPPYFEKEILGAPSPATRYAEFFPGILIRDPTGVMSRLETETVRPVLDSLLDAERSVDHQKSTGRLETARIGLLIDQLTLLTEELVNREYDLQLDSGPLEYPIKLSVVPYGGERRDDQRPVLSSMLGKSRELRYLQLAATLILILAGLGMVAFFVFGR